MIRWFFERFEKSIGGAEGQPVGVINDADFTVADERPIQDLLFDLTNLLDLDLWCRQFTVRFDHEEIGMYPGVDVPA